MSFDGTPLRKKARFSEHPQVFEYSSKSKRANDTDNDSLLLDVNYEEPRQNKYDQCSRFRQKQFEAQENMQKEIELELKEITSDLAEIEAYLNQQSKPMIEEPISMKKTPLKQEERKQKERFSFNFKPQLRSGRQTMNIEQQLKVRSITKEMSDEISNNKKRMMSIREQQKDSTKNIDEKIGNQIKKNKRITMDVKQLINMINDYNSEDQQRKLRENRKNRITMDVFALSKMLETVQLQDNDLNQKRGLDGFAQTTPEKTLEKSNMKNCIFSTFKQKPHQTQIKLFVQSYLSQPSKRLRQKQIQNKRQSEILSDMKSQLLKIELKISDKKKKLQRMGFERASLQNRLKKAKEELNSVNAEEDILAIQEIEKKLRMQILKCEIKEQGCYGHFMFQNIFLKAKSKSKIGQTEVKFSASNQTKYEKKFNYFSVDDSIKILKLYHKSNQERLLHFLEAITKLRRAYQQIKRLDNDIYHLSLAFEVANFQIDYLEEKLFFQVMTGGISIVLVSIKIIDYMGENQSWKSITLYNVEKGRYITLDMPQYIDQQQSLLIEMFKRYIDEAV